MVDPKATTDKLIEKARRVGNIQNKAKGTGAERPVNKHPDLHPKRRQEEVDESNEDSTEEPQKKIRNLTCFT